MLVLKWTLFLATICLSTSQYNVKIYPQVHSQNGRTRFESNRWNAHNVLDPKAFIAESIAIGSRAGRWINPDLNHDVFTNATEDPNRKGYPDPSYFSSPSLLDSLCVKSGYLDNLSGYGRNLTVIMETRSQQWPEWMNTSQYGGIFPNNLDAGAEFPVLMVTALHRCTGGLTPPLFEVMNEPETTQKNVNWESIIQYHKLVAQKLHAKFPSLKVGGPTRDGIISLSDTNDFLEWKKDRDFLDMSLYNMDFFSFHPYNWLYSYNGKHNFTGIDEARLVAVIDLIQAYAAKKTGKIIPLVTSEFGLGRRYVDAKTPASLIQWAYVFTYNSEIFTFLDNRDVMEQAVAFLLCCFSGQFNNANLFYINGTETPVSFAYRFWKNFSENDQFLRVEGEFNGNPRMMSPLALYNSESGKVTVLLHNREQVNTSVKLNFDQSWIQPTTGSSTCVYLETDQKPVFAIDKTIDFKDNVVVMPSEGTCYFTFTAVNHVRAMPTFVEKTFYAEDLVVSISNNAADTTVNIPDAYSAFSATLRVSVSYPGRRTRTTPTQVQVNDAVLTGFYSLYDSYAIAATLWEVHIYDVPSTVLKNGRNVIKMDFAQNGGTVSSVSMRVGQVVNI